MNMNRRGFLKGIGLSAAGIAVGGCLPMAASDRKISKRPNVLVLFTDDQRFNTVGALNNPAVMTPNIDKIVRRGTAFDKAFIYGSIHGAVCMPSRAMLMTGRHLHSLPDTVRVTWQFPVEQQGKCDYTTFPEVFRSAGYRTFATGKQHNGKPWIERGFTNTKSLFMGGMSNQFDVRLCDYSPETGWSKDYKRKGDFSATIFADAAVDFIENQTADDPFMMYVSFTTPHDPRTAPKKYHQMYDPDKIQLPPNFMPAHPFAKCDLRVRDEKLAGFPRTEKEVKQHIADYYSIITATDYEIGRILDALQASGKTEDTIIVFAGDNGLALGQHGLMGKQSLYEHSIRVPFVVAGPGVKAGQRRQQLVYLHDVFPTICELSGLKIPDSVQSESAAGYIADPGKAGRQAMFHTYCADREIMTKGFHQAVRKGDLKLIISGFRDKVTYQLFDLKNDPWEMENLAMRDSCKDRLEELKKLLDSMARQANEPVVVEGDKWRVS